MTEWLKQNSAILAMAGIILTAMTFIRYELRGDIQSVRTEIRAEVLGEIRVLQKQFEQLQHSLNQAIPLWLNTETRSIRTEAELADVKRRVEILEKRR